MKKTVYLEKSLKNYLKTLKTNTYVPGLLLGQTSNENDFIVHLARTQIPKESQDSICSLQSINNLREEWIIDHIRNVIQMLPGGMTVLGLFFVGDGDIFTNSSSMTVLKNVLAIINNFIKENEFYFVDSFSSQKLILHYASDSNLICKRFTTSQAGCYFDAVECVLSLSNWHRISCYYDFEHILPLYVKSITNAVLHDKIMEILSYVSKSVKESILLFNGEIRNRKDFIKNIKEKLNKRISQNAGEPESPTQILVDLYAPFIQQLSDKSPDISDYTAELRCFGTLCSDVYLHDQATVNDAIQAIKEDIIRSLYSRLTMHCNSLLEDLNPSTSDETKIIHEPPRRISVMLPHSKVRFTDYLFPGEEYMSTLPAREQLDIKNVEDDQKLYEPLEVETDAAEFYSSDNVTSNSGEKFETGKNVLRYILSVGAVLSILVIIFAVLLQKFHF